jgi:hypothetical protein
MPYPVIMNGDHAEIEREHANTPPHERQDWPLPSFDAVDWAAAFCKINPKMPEDIMVTWFANALMRGFDEHAARTAGAMQWEDARSASIDEDAYYLVQTNGGEWRDFDLAVLNGRLVARRMGPNYVRGRPMWVAKIDRPTGTS